MQFDELKTLLGDQFPEAILREDANTYPKCLTIQKELIVEACRYLHGHERTYFDSLSCITGVDNGPEKKIMEVIYNLYSIPYDHHLMLRVELDREKPEVDSVTGIWLGANWHEREAYDLLGINFVGHPDLRRILLPDDWEDHPLRKDYQEQDHYHGIKVKY